MNEVWEKVYKAYTFSFPLMIMDATVRVSTNTVEPGGPGKAPANRWMHGQIRWPSSEPAEILMMSAHIF